MKRTLFVTMAVAVSLTLALSGVSHAAEKDGGALCIYAAKLQPGPKGGAAERWIKPGTDFSKYNKVMLDSVIFYFAPDSEDKGIDPVVMKELSDSLNMELVDALKDKYPIVTEPGPDVVRIKYILTGIKQSKPVLSAITSVTPPGLVVNVVKKGVTGSWTGSGATGAEVIATDTETNEVIFVARDKQTASFTKRFSEYGSADEAFKFWAGRLRTFLDQSHGVK